MNEVTVFQNDQFGEVRTMTIDGEPWFVAVDVCRALEINNSRMATERLDDDEKTAVSLTDTRSIGMKQTREMTVINESGLYSLVLSSRLPAAKAFKRWVTSEVIPAIRKSGSYSLSLSPAEQLVAQAQLLLEQERRLAVLEDEQKHIITKVDQLETLFESKRNLIVGMDWYTITGYIGLMKYRVRPDDYGKLSKKASQISREKGYKIGSAPHPVYGTVGVYSTDILKEVFDNYDGKW